MPDPRVVLVTGAARGIGWATARRFAQSGDHVAVADLDATACEARAAELGPGHMAIAADMAREDQAAAMVDAVRRRYGRLDVLVNNAGRTDPRAFPALDQDMDAFRALLAVNLHGGHAAALAAAQAMAGQPGGGAIVNTASGAGFVAVPLRHAYGAAKAAVVATTRRLARDWAGHGVRVNAVAPGYIRTEMVDALVRAGKVDLARVERRVPMGRLGLPDEIAAVTMHLASADAAALNGAVLVADGGYLAFGGTGDASAGAPPPVETPATRVIVVAGEGPAATAVARAFVAAGDAVEAVACAPSEITGVARRHGRLDVLVAIAPNGASGFTIAPNGASGFTIAPNGASGFAIAPNGASGFGTTPGGAPGGFAAEVNGAVAGIFEACRAAAPSMLAQRSGSIVAMVVDAAGCGSAAGDAAAAAVAMLARSLACEWAASGIRVNALRVGAGDTAARTASTVRFLASADASYVTGATLDARPRPLPP